MATAVTTSAPWSAQQPYLTFGFNEARKLYNTGGPQYFPKNTVAPLSNQTQQGIQQYTQTANQGTPVADSAQNQVNATLQGDYLNSNPYLDAMYNNAAGAVTRNYQEAVAPSIAANFGLSGRSGSNMAFANAMDSSRDTLSRNLSGMASNIYGGAYENERGRQMQAASIAPQTAGLNYFDANQLLQAGQLQDTFNQNRLNDQVNRWNFNQNRGWDNLSRYNSLVGGTGYGSVNTQPQYSNSLGNTLGLLSAGIGGLDELRGIGGIQGIPDWARGIWGP